MGKVNQRHDATDHHLMASSRAPEGMSVSEPGVDRHELNLIFSARHVVILTFQILSYFGRDRALDWWEPAIDLGLVLPYSAVTHWVALRKLRMPGWVPIVDSLVIVAWVVAMPETSPTLVAMLVAVLTIAGQSVARRWLWTAFGLSSAGMLASALLANQLSNFLDAARSIILGACVLMTVTMVRSARLEAQRRLAYTAQHDQLTGLANRSLLHHEIGAVGPDRDLAVLLADLNNFKEVNDALGHHVGDDLLVAVSHRVVDVAPAAATVGRLGGDEFAVVIPDSNRADAIGAADRITAALRQPFTVDGLTIEVGASIGIALRNPGAPAPVPSDVLFRNADVAMYQAKQAGRPFRVYDPSDDHSSVRRVTLMGELRTAIADGQLEVWYQPGLDAHTGQLNCMEALVRWNHPQHGLLLPGEFIELAEISGAIDDLTQWVIDRAVRDSHRLSALGRPLLVSCNLSVRNLHDRLLLEWLDELATTVGLPDSGLYLELTESQIMEDPAGASHVLTRLAEMGIGSAVDDFGTGYSSLSMLLHVRASVLKIDRSFVADLLRTREASVMVRSMIDLAHNLGMLVVAEGVEDQMTLERLEAMGCDFLQGFHIARPMPFDQLAGFLGLAPAEGIDGVSPVIGAALS